jgi:hypothetical protein
MLVGNYKKNQENSGKLEDNEGKSWQNAIYLLEDGGFR